MKKEKLFVILIPLCVILCAVLAVISYFKIINNNSDAIKFKKEYESLNNKVNENNKKYKKIKISNNNPIVYSSYDELINVIKNGTGVIYLGFPECPWCRSALPVLLDVLKDYDIEKLYYLNIKNERDSYVVKDGKIIYELDSKGNEIKGTEGYFKLLDALGDNLTEYTLLFEGEIYKTGEKRLYAPSVIFVKDGKVLGIHVSTVETQESGYDKLTKEESLELYSIYEDYILEMTSETCEIDSSC